MILPRARLPCYPHRHENTFIPSSALEPANGVGHILVGYNPEDLARDRRVSPVTPWGKTKRTEELCRALITARNIARRRPADTEADAAVM